MRVRRNATARMARRAFILVAMCVPIAAGIVAAGGPPGAEAPSPAGAITLEQAVDLALSASPDVAAAVRALEAARMRLAAAQAMRAPAITLRATPAKISWAKENELPVPDPGGTQLLSSAVLDVYVPVGDARVTLSIDATYLSRESREPERDAGWSISLSWPILGQGAVGPYGAQAGTGSCDEEMRAARAAARSASFALERAKQKARSTVESAYYSVLREQGKLRAAEVNLERMRAHLGIVEARFAQGNASRLDLLDAEERVAAAQASLNAAKHGVVLSGMSFNKAVGRDLSAPVNPAPAGEYVKEVFDLEKCVGSALANRREPAMAKDDLRDREADLAGSRKGLLPQVSLQGGLKDDGSWSVGIELTKTLTQDYSAQATLKAAENAVLAAQANIDAARQAIVLDVTQAYYSLLEAEEALALAGSGLARAEAALDAEEKQYRMGAAAHQDLSSAIATVHEGKVKLLDAVASCFMARSRLFEAMGGRNKKE